MRSRSLVLSAIAIAGILTAALADGPARRRSRSPTVPRAEGTGTTGAAAVRTASPASAAANAGYTAANLPDWAIVPFARSADNPLLTPSGSGYEGLKGTSSFPPDSSRLRIVTWIDDLQTRWVPTISSTQIRSWHAAASTHGPPPGLIRPDS